jgi:protein-disulfide isomerase
MNPLTFLALPLALLCLASASSAQEWGVLAYEGRVSVAGTNFTGPGLFVFLIRDQAGDLLWSSGDAPAPGATANPTNPLKLPVTQGAYSVRLGDKAAGLPPLNVALLKRAPAPRLEIWFNDSTHGWHQTGDAVPLQNLLANLSDPGNQPITAAQADAIMRELRELRALVAQQGRSGARPSQTPSEPEYATVDLADAPSLGRSNAALVMVEFIDYQCPHCRRFHDTILPDLKRRFVDTGKLRLISRNLPLAYHPGALPAAQAALCANQQHQFWPMHDLLFAATNDLSPSALLQAATDLKLDLPQFRSCLDGKAFEGRVRKESQDAAAAGIRSTPSFVLGKPNGSKMTGLIIVGAQPFADFEIEILRLLAE